NDTVGSDYLFLDNGFVANTLAGNDSLTGTNPGSGSGIDNAGTINTGVGNDTLTGIGDGYGSITNRGNAPNSYGTINTGAGDDLVQALQTNGGIGTFDNAPNSAADSVGTIQLGSGKDRIKGFGPQSVNGGSGFDTAELGINFHKSLLALGTSPTPTSITIGSMAFTNVENFVFNNGTYSLAQLRALV
ncbi:MAG TPA: hypothetical protein V6C65_21320, partial [Allocoleopsis sp.]